MIALAFQNGGTQRRLEERVDLKVIFYSKKEAEITIYIGGKSSHRQSDHLNGHRIEAELNYHFGKQSSQLDSW
ncbi:hypothetical protein HI914_00097 [Erysiphe necator]|nr:hypothetical protein HI914_00097 [Erysiphe necator]